MNQVGSDSASKLDNQNIHNHIGAWRANHVLGKFYESKLAKSKRVETFNELSLMARMLIC